MTLGDLITNMFWVIGGYGAICILIFLYVEIEKLIKKDKKE
jgi:hypothetical protein